MRCPKCKCRFIAGTGKVLTPGTISGAKPEAAPKPKAEPEPKEKPKPKPEPKPEPEPEPKPAPAPASAPAPDLEAAMRKVVGKGETEKKTKEKPAMERLAETRKVKCILCDFDVESRVPRGTPINCPMCHSTFSEEPEDKTEIAPEPPDEEKTPVTPPSVPAAVSPESPTDKSPPPKPEPPAGLDVSEDEDEDTPTRSPVKIEPGAKPAPPPKPEPPPQLRSAPTEEAPQPDLQAKPIVESSAAVRDSLTFMNRPLEIVAATGISALIGTFGVIMLFLLFFDNPEPPKALFGPGGTMVLLPVITMGCAIVMLGIWQREMWGWIFGVLFFGLGTLGLAIMLSQEEIIPAAVLGTVALILLIFSRLSGRYT
jgi:hypothetical protein